jgi:hypothetical protein
MHRENGSRARPPVIRTLYRKEGRASDYPNSTAGATAPRKDKTMTVNSLQINKPARTAPAVSEGHTILGQSVSIHDACADALRAKNVGDAVSSRSTEMDHPVYWVRSSSMVSAV